MLPPVSAPSERTNRLGGVLDMLLTS